MRYAQKVREDKPADLVDQCELVGGVAVPGSDCPALVRFYPSPSQQAGESLRNDILKCQLKPLRREDYDVTFTDAQWERLQEQFGTHESHVVWQGPVPVFGSPTFVNRMVLETDE